LTPGWPVTSIQVTPESVVFAPLVTTQVGSLDPVVPATTQANTRSLPTAGVADCRRGAPATTAVLAAHAVTALHCAESAYQTVGPTLTG